MRRRGQRTRGGLRFGPRPGQGTEAKTAVGGNLAFGLAVVVRGAGDAFEQPRQQRGADGGRCGNGGRGEPRGERGALARSFRPPGVVQGRSTLGRLQPSIRGNPGLEESCRFERSFDAGTLGGGEVLAKIDQLPQRGTGALRSCLGAAGVELRRGSIFALREPLALGVQCRLLFVQGFLRRRAVVEYMRLRYRTNVWKLLATVPKWD